MTTVRGGGSSIILRTALAAPSVMRSASSTMITCQRPWDGARAATRTISRASSTPIDSPSGLITFRSAWVPARTVWQAWQVPSPPSGHCRAAANARAATDLPDPGGPVNSQAWVIAPASATAARSSATAVGWPTTPAQTPSLRVAVMGASSRSRAARWWAALCSCLRLTCRSRVQLRRRAGLGVRPVALALGRWRTRSRRPSQLLQRQALEQLGDPDPDVGGDLVGRPTRVEDQVAVGVRLGQGPEGLPHPLVEVERLGLHAVGCRTAARAGQPLVRRQVEQDRQVGHQALGGPAGQHADVVQRDRPAGSLI